MKLDNIIDRISRAEFKKLPNKILIDVGINNLDSNKTPELIRMHEEIVDTLNQKVPPTSIYINSILLRKVGLFTTETNEINNYLTF